LAGTAVQTPGPRKRGPYAKSSETRERILEAAFEVAGEVGIHRASVAGIAERAGVAVGNLHYHFGSRDDLLRELMQWVLGVLLDEMQDASAENDDFLAAQAASMRAYLAFVHRNPAYVRLAEEVRLHHPDLYRVGMAMWLSLLREVLEQASQRGELRAMDAGEIAVQAHFLLGVRYFLDQMIEGVDGRDYPGDERVVAAYLNLIRSGLAKETR
jgi:AcrR family transcriptional regulator